MLGLLTYSGCRDLTEDDRLLAQALAKKSVPLQIVDWNLSLPANDVTTLLIRSPWDYYLKAPQFLKYLDDCEERGIRVINDAAITRWNHSKHYLTELKAKGLPIVDSYFVSSTTTVPKALSEIVALGWMDLVIKPAISASSYLTFRTRADSTYLPSQIEQILQKGDLIAQPFLESIKNSGEISLIYFNDGKPEYSHAVHKRPKSGDFRVQNDFGGHSVFIEPPTETHKIGERTLAALPANWLYTRVDLVDCDTSPLISEVEMIEPSLYFLQHPKAADRLAEIIAAKRLY